MSQKGGIPHYMRATGAAGSSRHSTNLNLNNVDTDKLFIPKSKPQRPRSAITKTGNKVNQKDKRRIKSATERRTDNFVSKSCQLLTLYEGNEYHESMEPKETIHKVVALKVMNLNVEEPNGTKTKDVSKTPSCPAFSNTNNRTEHLSLNTDIKQKNGTSLKPSKSSNIHTFPPEDLVHHITHQIPNCLSGLGVEGSLFLLPDLDAYAHNLPVVPAPMSADEELPFTHVIPDKKLILGPKKYTHPFFERMKKIQGWQCKHVNDEIRIESVRERTTLYSHIISERRDQEEVRDEIRELERLMKGLSSDFGTSSVVLYQNEINSLQEQIKSLNLPDVEKEPATPDPTGLRRFFKEYETALQALEERRRQCILELRKIEEVENLYERAKYLEANS